MILAKDKVLVSKKTGLEFSKILKSKFDFSQVLSPSYCTECCPTSKLYLDPGIFNILSLILFTPTTHLIGLDACTGSELAFRTCTWWKFEKCAKMLVGLTSFHNCLQKDSYAGEHVPISPSDMPNHHVIKTTQARSASIDWLIISKCYGTSTPKGSYSAKTGESTRWLWWWWWYMSPLEKNAMEIQ